MDSAKISEIADIMRSHGLTRVRVEDPDGSAVELECGGAPAAAPAPVPFPAPAAPAAPAPASAPAPAPAPVPAGDEPLDMSHTTAVRAPMVGVFYAAPAPGAEPFVQVGSKVKKGDTLCVIEAMKVMNEVTAEEDGEVVDICVHDGDLVEYGCCLMKIY
ncbi:MAG TPA: acetyl-CoA carboxylase biotin carboxyl carrier protein [Candidatus Olsenella avicola]|uniref:acetyl-CoA carboxylase biotin carboxyl carrier protein n=1 Tax=Olsenella sp. An285 TaxID=1965621 RepID=UPI000B39D3D3|nr:acetyl-CoA carboxylase biotin carboxyl carrier protein [Olsenella sp. An285]OUO46964.1 acetyl-CoA carboxylase, biotin carboxyl carrier protein [Olsenella sp. An285]HIY52118.1 acetyl-CoA carboxylase biotin carboxyl carrier protein [Candidatus Olsenella avicola]